MHRGHRIRCPLPAAPPALSAGYCTCLGPEGVRKAWDRVGREALVRTAVRGGATYRLGWFDAHMWAYAHEYGLAEILSEDFQHERLYGTVRATNPFI